MKKRIIITCALCVALSMTACGTDKTVASNTDATEVTTTTILETTTSSVGESSEASVKSNYSWTMEELSKKIVLNGKQILLPCTLNDLGDDYSFSEKITKEKYEDGLSFLNAELLYKGETCALIDFLPPLDNTGYEKATIFNILGPYDSKFDFSVGDFKVGATKDNLIKKYGEPTKKSPEGVINVYFFSKRQSVIASYDKNNVLKEIVITYLPN